ncbi:MAG: permease [Pirellulaceae bacterium]|nr:permease [Pirellulaceae bacterium]
MTAKKYQWARAGDVNAFFGLMLDNVAGLLLAVSLLAVLFEFPTQFALQYMVPGTAIGVLVGDLLFFWLAFRLARSTGSNTVTAMPLGLDTPSTFGMVFFVLGPAFTVAKTTMSVDQAALHTWHIGICAIFLSGVFKSACAFGSNWIRRLIPRAGLLGSLAAIALVLISFLPLVEILHTPIIGLIALSIVLTSLIGRIRMPGNLPGTLVALIVAGTMFHIMNWMGWLDSQAPLIAPHEALMPTGWTTVFHFEWLDAFGETMRYLPVILPFALATVVGGIDCTESAAAVGDEYDTRLIVAGEGIATLVASLCGGVIQTTPYIGHPAYKAMGGRAAYTLATALFIGSAGVFGFFAYLYVIIPKAAVFPILVFIGLEITSQSFQATPKRHYPAVALACIPALAYLALIYADKVIGENNIQLSPALGEEIQTLRILSNGYIVTSLLWASTLAAIIDRRLRTTAIFLLITAICALFGVIHSPLAGSPMYLPWQLDSHPFELVIRYVTGYLLAALILLGLHYYTKAFTPPNAEADSTNHAEAHT